MTDYEKKEENVANNVTDTVVKLDSELDKLNSLNEDTSKEHEFKKWYAEKKAIHEIKHILYDAGKYDKYDEDEMNKIDTYFENLK
ncbi:hypothetical protein KUA55_12490 [Enterococcus sp. ALS3]|uniref:Uncharacterized protein n=1 Tax=Enterococcus alishanensis TaxID=1303817 RepID=A0ABS6TEZ1_9ENTE|nr:hypothetical protein [Enterococcus alishanensis]MBV7391503.1 hypothetical protein [Enterococcus alishanensis]